MTNTLQARKEITTNLLKRAKTVSHAEFVSTKAAIDNIQHSYKDPMLQLLILKQML
jgi:hypothetical protein